MDKDIKAMMDVGLKEMERIMDEVHTKIDELCVAEKAKLGDSKMTDAELDVFKAKVQKLIDIIPGRPIALRDNRKTD